MHEEDRHRARRPAALIAPAAAFCCIGGGLAVGGGLWPTDPIAGTSWLLTALASRLFVATALISLGSGLGIALLIAMLWRIGRKYRLRRPEPQGGSAIIEFTLILPILLMLVLIMAQSSLLMAGNLCVHYAAFCAARSAVVTVPRDVGFDEPPNIVIDSGIKMSRLEAAAIWAVLPISSSSDRFGQAVATNLRHGLNDFYAAQGQDAPPHIDAYIERKLQYARDHTWVRLAPPEQGAGYGDNEDLKLTVTHTYYLSIPYAANLFSAVLDDGVDLGGGYYGLDISTSCRLPNEGVQDFVDNEVFGTTGS